MDTKYSIEVKKSQTEGLKLDGKTQQSKTIQLANDKKNHKILLTIK